jgi:hypothetical protein
LANWEKGNSMLIIDFLLSLWKKKVRFIHSERFTGSMVAALEELLDTAIKRILELIIRL